MKQWFLDGGPKIGTVLTLDTPALPELVRIAGFDWAWIDGEHGAFDAVSAGRCAAILGSTVKSFVRVPDAAPATLKRFLDSGCDGIIVPHVNTRAEVDAIVRASLYPPAGMRSAGISRAQGYGAYFKQAITARGYAIIVQIETAEAVANVEEIIAARELDAVLIGPYDLSGSLGVMGDVSAKVVVEAIATVLAACKRASMPCGIFAGDGERARACVAQGFDFVGAGVDAMLLHEALKSVVTSVRSAVPKI